MSNGRKPVAPKRLSQNGEVFADPVEGQDECDRPEAADVGLVAEADSAQEPAREDLAPESRFRDSLQNPIEVRSEHFESVGLTRAERLQEMIAMMGHAGD